MAAGDETLKGTRQPWLYNPQNFSAEQAEEFSALKDLHLKVARAWAAKELFSKFWEYQEEGWARRFFKNWFGWIRRSRLKPVIEVAQMLKRHLDPPDVPEASEWLRPHERKIELSCQMANEPMSSFWQTLDQALQESRQVHGLRHKQATVPRNALPSSTTTAPS